MRLEAGHFPEGVSAALADRTTAAAHYDEALDDDLNTAEPLGAVFEFVRDSNTAMDAGEFLVSNASCLLISRPPIPTSTSP